MSSVADFNKNPEKELRKLYSESKNKCTAIIANKFSFSKEEIQDIFQQAVLIVWENIEKKKIVEGKLEPYLIGIMKNLCLTHSRKIKSEREKKESGIVESILNSEENQFAKIKEERFKVIYDCLDKMGDPCKKMLTLFYIKEKSFKEIAQIMGYNNENTAKAIKFKCMKRLQKLINDI